MGNNLNLNMNANARNGMGRPANRRDDQGARKAGASTQGCGEGGKRAGARPDASHPMRQPTYVVHDGDTMESVARHFGVSPDDVQVANPGLAGVHLMHGDVLTIPHPGAHAYRPGPSTSHGPAPRAYSAEQARADAKDLFEATEGGLTSYGTDEQKLFSVLDGKTGAELDTLRKEYMAEYGHSLDDVLRSETSGDDLERVDALLKGTDATGAKVANDTLAIGGEIESMWANESEVLGRLEKASPKERDAIVHAYAQKYGPASPGQSDRDFFMAHLERKFNADEMTQARGYLSNDAKGLGEAGAAKAHQALDKVFSPDIDALKGVFQGRTTGDIAAIKSAYLARYGISLESHIKRDVQGPAHDVVARLMAPPHDSPRARAEAGAERLHEAVDGMGTDLAAIRRELSDKTPQEIRDLSQAFADRTGETLAHRLTDETSGSETDEILHYLSVPEPGDKAGRASWVRQGEAMKMRVAVRLVGADDTAIRQVLEHKSKSEIDQLADAYKSLYKEDLRARLVSELDGRKRLELVHQLFDQGAAQSPRESLARLRERRDFEQNDLTLTNVIQSVVRGGETDAARTDRHLDLAEKALARHDLAATRAELAYGQNDLDSTITSRKAIADAATTGVVLAATGVAIAASDGLALPAVPVALQAAGIGLYATAKVQSQLNPQSGWREIARQSVINGMSGAIPLPGAGRLAGATEAAALKVLGKPMAAKVARTLAVGTGEFAAQGGAAGAGQAISENNKLKGKHVVSELVKAAATGATGGMETGGPDALFVKAVTHATRALRPAPPASGGHP